MTPETAVLFKSKAHASPIDIYVGSRIRLARHLCGLSQTDLSNALGLTFQQVQKYERGVNRVGASRLFEISRVLGVSISYFFDDMPESISGAAVSGPRGRFQGVDCAFKEANLLHES